LAILVRNCPVANCYFALYNVTYTSLASHQQTLSIPMPGYDSTNQSAVFEPRQEVGAH